MPKIKIGILPPRYSLLLNSHTDVRFSKCPKCQKLTHLRKFPLFIHIDGWGPMVLGKTFRYCSSCEMVMAHRKELEAELAYGLSRMAPEIIAKDFLVLGDDREKDVEARAWKSRKTDCRNVKARR